MFSRESSAPRCISIHKNMKNVPVSARCTEKTEPEFLAQRHLHGYEII